MTPPIPPLSPEEVEIVNGLDGLIRPTALVLRERVLMRGVPFVFRDGFRSREEQQRLFDTLPPGQAARPGNSQHEIGTAFDIRGPTGDEQWNIVGAEGEALGLEWGGRFRTTREPWHFEAPLPRQQLVFIQSVRALAVVGAVGIGFAIVKGM